MGKAKAKSDLLPGTLDMLWEESHILPDPMNRRDAEPQNLSRRFWDVESRSLRPVRRLTH
jgi:hypothetical protein